jgi:hypothetical protein
MKPTRRDLNEMIDRASEQIRSAELDPGAAATATERVRARLAAERPAVAQTAVEHITGCADFEALIPAYLTGSLKEERALLLEDHTRECIACRKAVKAVRTGEPVTSRVPKTVHRAPRRTAPVRWAIAAGLVAAFGLLPVTRYLLPGGGIEATVEAAEGSIYEIGDVTTRPLALGDSVEGGERIRTSAEAGAVLKLADGSRIELRERSELAIADSGGAPSVRLARGSIIVTPAAKDARVYVAAPAVLVTADGSSVSVTSGTKGTRVSAIDGEARIVAGGEERTVRAGDQFASSASIESVPVAREVSWSRNADKYSQALAELSALRRELDAVALRTEARYSSRLLDRVPADTVFYAAIPNIGTTLGEANRILQQRISESEALRTWWEAEHKNGKKGIGEAVEKLSALGTFLGDEVVLAVAEPAPGSNDVPVILAEVTDAASLRTFIQAAAAVSGAKASDIRFIDDPATAEASPAEMNVYISGDTLVASPSLDRLRAAASTVGFAGTPFHARISDEYREGVEFLIAADLSRLMAAEASRDAKESAAMQRLGLTDLEYFVAKASGGERADTRAVLSFAGERRGMASWLAAPGPMGALDYISPDANVVAAFVVNDPAQLVDDLLGVIGASDPQALEHLRRFEAEHGVNIRDDFAAPLGGEFAFAVDGPVLPIPSWKMVLEVNDPARFEASIERVITEVNAMLAAEGKPQIAHAQSTATGRTVYSVTTPESANAVHYTFVNGYMIVGPSEALVDRAVRFRESGYTLSTSPRFAAALPSDGNANFSAILYHDLGSLLSGVADKLPAAEGSDLAAMISENVPTLAFAYARENRIEFGTTGSGGPFGLSPSTLLGVPGSMGLQKIFERSVKVD